MYNIDNLIIRDFNGIVFAKKFGATVLEFPNTNYISRK